MTEQNIEVKEEQKFELILQMSEKGIICNTETLKAMLPDKLKPYKYVVTVNNSATAKVDRTKLNNLCDLIQSRRKQFEEVELADWKTYKAGIMDLEKMIKAVADELGDGIKALDEKEKLEKMEEVKESYFIVAQNMPLQVPFESLYDRKKYDPKAMTIKKINADMQIKIDRIKQDYSMMELFYPEDDGDKEQVKQVYIETLDIGKARAKASELQAVRERLAQQSVNTQRDVETLQEPSKTSPEPQPQKKQRVVAQFIATRAFYDEMNQVVKNHQAQVKVLEREDV